MVDFIQCDGPVEVRGQAPVMADENQARSDGRRLAQQQVDEDLLPLGKSTLLGLLGGVAVPQAGRIELLGQDLAQLGSHARDRFRADHIGFLFQQFNLLPWLSAIDNVLLPCTFSARRKRRAEPDPRAAAATLLTQLDLDPTLWNRPAAELSVGQQQRVAAARALIGRPEILIADEPTSAQIGRASCRERV